jgi:hypothetical protein
MIALADVAVVVSNAKTSARWWTKNLGFATYAWGNSGHPIMVAPPGDRFVLHLCEGFAPLEPGDTGIAFVTDSIEPLVARMTKGSVQFPEPLKKAAWGMSAKFADPDGNIFWLFEMATPMVRKTATRRAPVKKSPAAKRRSTPRKRR